MEYPKYFNPKNSVNLYGLQKNFLFLSSLYTNKKLPKVLMLSGAKGSGKSTLINHLLFSIFDENNYNNKKFNLINNSIFFNQFKSNIFQNIIYLKGSDFKTIKVEDIRNLKSKILQTTIINRDRFIILDDIELFNINSLNALLKIIEEPSKNNYFFLINNKSKPLLETIKSRSLELKIILSKKTKIEIINELIKYHKIEIFLDPVSSNLTPGAYIKFNYIFKELNISINSKFPDNLSLLLNLHKKNKDSLFIDIILYLTDSYFKNLKVRNIIESNNSFENKHFILNNLNKYLTFNLNHNSLINAINNKLNHG